MQSVAFLGLGVMGYPMAGHLQRAGLRVTVYNRNPEKAQRWCDEYAGMQAATPADAATNADVLFCCVGRDEDVRAVLLGDTGALKTLATDSIVVDHTTTSAQLPRDLERLCRERGLGFIDAPVSGGQAGAEQGRLTVMAGGEPATYARVAPLIAHYAKQCRLLGPAGSGQLAKMVNQICIAGLVQGLAEGLQFAQRAGLDARAAIEVIQHGAAQSWQMDNRHQSMLDNHYQHGFAVDWMRKDLAYAMDEARRNGSQLPVTTLVDQFYAEVQQMGGGRWDTSSLLARLLQRHEQTHEQGSK